MISIIFQTFNLLFIVLIFYFKYEIAFLNVSYFSLESAPQYIILCFIIFILFLRIILLFFSKKVTNLLFLKSLKLVSILLNIIVFLNFTGIYILGMKVLYLHFNPNFMNNSVTIGNWLIIYKHYDFLSILKLCENWWTQLNSIYKTNIVFPMNEISDLISENKLLTEVKKNLFLLYDIKRIEYNNNYSFYDYLKDLSTDNILSYLLTLFLVSSAIIYIYRSELKFYYLGKYLENNNSINNNTESSLKLLKSNDSKITDSIELLSNKTKEIDKYNLKTADKIIDLSSHSKSISSNLNKSIDNQSEINSSIYSKLEKINLDIDSLSSKITDILSDGIMSELFGLSEIRKNYNATDNQSILKTVINHVFESNTKPIKNINEELPTIKVFSGKGNRLSGEINDIKK